MHYFPRRGIDLVWSLVPELNRQPKIFNHEHVPHLRLPHWVVGASDLEHASQRIFHICSTNQGLIPLCQESIRLDVLGHNREVGLCTGKIEMSKRNRGHRVLTWKTQQSWEKPRQSTNCRKSLWEKNTMIRKHRGNDLLQSFLATLRLQWRQRPLSLPLSHSLTSTQFTLYTHVMHQQLICSHN